MSDNRIEKLLTGWLKDAAEAASKGLYVWPSYDPRYVALELNAEAVSLRAQLAAANEAKEKAEKERDENKKYLEAVLACHQATSRDVLRYLNKARESEALLSSEREKYQSLASSYEKIDSELRRYIDKGYQHMELKCKAAEQKTAELAAVVQAMREALEKFGRHSFMCVCGKDRGAFCICGLEAASIISSPAAQVLAERDAEVEKRVWMEAAKLECPNCKKYGNPTSFKEDGGSYWVHKNAGLAGFNGQCSAQKINDIAAALSSKSAIGPEKGEI